MMRQFGLLSLLIGLMSITFYACQHKLDNPVPGSTTNTGGNGGGSGGTGGGTAPDTSLCFERDILPVFISNCAKSGCHDAASHEEGFVFTSWQTITSKEFVSGNANATELFEKITEDNPDKIMPPPPNAPLTPGQIALIREWINRGAPNTTGCVSGCDSTKFSFSGVIRPLLDNNCKGCHNAGSPSAGFSYDDHAGVVAAVNSGRFMGAVRHQAGYLPMPQGGNKLSDCQIKQIENWIAGGMPND